MKMMGEIFVMGRTIDEAMRRMRRPRTSGFTASFDMLGEAARTTRDAERYFQAYVDAIDAVGSDAGGGAFDLGQALRAPPALRGGAAGTSACRR